MRGRMAGLGERPKTVYPAREKVGLLELLGGIDEARIAGWIRSAGAGAGATPRLRYEWP